MFIDVPTEVGLSTFGKSPSCDGSITGHTSWVFLLLDVPKESFTPGEPDADESYMALTFGTLLSSQGADAHRHGPFGQIGGNPRYFTWSVPLGQTPAPAQTPTWSGRSKKIFGPRAWGNIRPAPLLGSPLGSPALAAPSRGQEEH